jgi:hypothetical protein
MRSTKERVNQLTRNAIEYILTEHGFQVYDDEPTEVLREALLVNVEDGTIPKSELEVFAP